MLNPKNKKARIREAKRIKFLQHLEGIKDTAKLVWYGADYTHEGSRYYKARAKAFGLSWRDASYWRDYWIEEMCSTIPTETIFDYNPTLDEIKLATGGHELTKEEYLKCICSNYCQDGNIRIAYPWLIATGNLVLLWLARKNTNKAQIFFSRIPRTKNVGHILALKFNNHIPNIDL